MLKSFIRLMAFIILPFFLIVFVEPFNPVKKINNHLIEDYMRGIYGGIFYLIEQHIDPYPEEEWSDHFKAIKKHFGYDINFNQIDDLNIESHFRDRLKLGDIVFIEGDDDSPPQMLKKIKDTSWVADMRFDSTKDEGNTRILSGPNFLFNHLFAKHSEDEWPELIEAIKQNFDIDMLLITESQLELPKASIEQFYKKGMTWEDIDYVGEMFYLRINESQYVLKVGPVSNFKIQIQLLINLLGIILIFISIGLLSWLRPLWKDIKHLNKTAVALGQGALNERVKLKRGSVVKQLGESFNQMAMSLQKLLQTNQQLTNAVAHDLRTPLTRLRFALEILETGDCTPEESERYKKMIHNSIDGLDYLINQLLTYSRYNRIANVEQFTRTDFSQVIENEVEEHQFSNEALSLSLKIANDVQHQTLFIDEKAMCRALNNLLSNATQFAQKDIHVEFFLKDKHYFLVVEDDGPGVKPEDYSKLFQAFVQLENQERDETLGHGLGLAIVDQIAKWHKGIATVSRSEALGGAKFSIIWPVNSQS